MLYLRFPRSAFGYDLLVECVLLAFAMRRASAVGLLDSVCRAWPLGTTATRLPQPEEATTVKQASKTKRHFMAGKLTLRVSRPPALGPWIQARWTSPSIGNGTPLICPSTTIDWLTMP